jgi:hypothetical protein
MADDAVFEMVPCLGHIVGVLDMCPPCGGVVIYKSMGPSDDLGTSMCLYKGIFNHRQS